MCDSFTRFLSPSEVAAALDVGESSVKRWIDAGVLVAEKTPGGHRRVTLSDLYSFLRLTGRQLSDPAAIGIGTGKSRPGSALNPLAKCKSSLQNGDAFALESLLQAASLSEPNLSTVLDKVVFPAFKEVRSGCPHPSEECLVLHRAIEIAQAALRSMMRPSERAASSQKAKPRIVLADVGYEVDGISTYLAEASVWDQAHCLQLGANVPVAVIGGALRSFDADILWLSASGPVAPKKVSDAFQRILQHAKKFGVRPVVFGDAVPRWLVKNAAIASSFAEFRGFVAGARNPSR